MKPRAVAVLFAVGMFLGQLAWITAVPPYRGIDEFDHVYRAASVAEGYWGPGVGVPRQGRGELVPLPAEIVADGAEICRSYAYTGPDNCRAVAAWGDDLVTVASAAARYNPAFYWLIGKPSRIASGAGAVYVMRLMAGLLSAVLVGLAAWVTSRSSQTRWPTTGLALALTPVVVYSTAVPAPNGIEMAGALCVWCSVLGLRKASDARTASLLVAVGVAGAVPLLLVRTLGPLWLALTLGVLAVTLGKGGLLSIRRRVPFPVATSAVVVVGASAVAGAWWSRSSGTNALESVNVDSSVSPWGPVLQEVPLWVLQSIAAFPLRNEPAPPVVYAIELTAFITFVVWALVRADWRSRSGVILTASLSLATPWAITMATVMVAGLVWQGRYTLPFAFGVVLIAGFALDDARAKARFDRPLLLIFGTLVASAHAISVVDVQRAELLSSPLANDPRWLTTPIWFGGMLSLVGAACWIVAVLRRSASVGEAEQRLTGAGAVHVTTAADRLPVTGASVAQPTNSIGRSS